MSTLPYSSKALKSTVKGTPATGVDVCGATTRDCNIPGATERAVELVTPEGTSVTSRLDDWASNAVTLAVPTPLAKETRFPPEQRAGVGVTGSLAIRGSQPVR